MGIVMPPWQKDDLWPILKQKTYAIFDGGDRLKSLPGLSLQLLAEQKKAWLDLWKGCESLKEVREREVRCPGFSVRLQYNPGRIKSSLASVGEKNGNERRCFLCLNHLPEGQKGVLYRSEYLLLCNPMPIFSPHFTVSHRAHRRQAILEHIEAFLQLMSDFGSRWMVFYNGPKCGASAPDHLHFQASPSGQMPIEEEIREEERLTLMTRLDGVFLYRGIGLGREVVILEGDDPVAIGGALKGFQNALKEILLVDEEPMMNIAGTYEERKWRLVIFPRRKHRPDAFFKKGDERVVVSPGLIDMGGVLVTPVKKDFEQLDAVAVESIYREVSLEAKTVERAIAALV
jgi:hypothetical protein